MKHLVASVPGSAAALLLCCAASAQALDVKRVAVSIPTQPVLGALKQLGEQTGLQLLIRVDNISVEGVTSQKVAGELTLESALDQVLANTGLSYEVVNDRTIRISRIDSKPSSSLGRPLQGFRVAEAQVAAAQDTGGGAQGTAPVQQQAPAGATSNGRMEEVLVTAQKREERLIDVPISIVALSANDLQKRNVNSVDDLPYLVPGLAIETVGWQRRIQLRGIGNGQGLFSLIGMYLDEASVTTTGVAQLDVNTYDLERVEVLRGPQGTLYGEGSVGGTLRFITKDPELDKFGASADVAALFTEEGGDSQELSAVVNIPVVTDKFGLRIVGSYNHDGGWMDQPALNRSDINGQNRSDVRVKALWKPTEAFAANAMAVIHRNNGSTNIGEDTSGNYTQAFGQLTTPQVTDDYDLYNLNLSYDLPSLRILNTSTYLDQERLATNFGYLSVTNPGAPVSNLYFTPYEPINRIYSNELRFSSNGTGPWQWTTGGMYRHAQLNLVQRFYFGVPNATGVLPAQINGDNQTLSESWAVFGDLSYKFADRLTLGTGLRYFEDDQTFTTTSTQTGKFDSVSPRFYAHYKIGENFSVYTSAAKGFRSGGFNALNRPSYGPEDIWSYELGTKSVFLDGRVSADIAAFYSEYSNYQIAGVVPTTGLNITSNAGDATVKGIEWQINVNPADGWTFGFNGNYLDTEFKSIVVTRSAFAVGDELPFIPEYQFTASAEKEFSLNTRRSFVRVDYDVQGRMNTRNRSIGTLFFGESDVIHRLELHAGVQLKDNILLSLFGQNLLNDRGFIDPYVFINNAARERPRTYGVRVNIDF